MSLNLCYLFITTPRTHRLHSNTKEDDEDHRTIYKGKRIYRIWKQRQIFCFISLSLRQNYQQTNSSKEWNHLMGNRIFIKRLFQSTRKNNRVIQLMSLSFWWRRRRPNNVQWSLQFHFKVDMITRCFWYEEAFMIYLVKFCTTNSISYTVWLQHFAVIYYYYITMTTTVHAPHLSEAWWSPTAGHFAALRLPVRELPFSSLKHDHKRVIGLRIKQWLVDYHKSCPSWHVIRVNSKDFTIQVYGIKQDQLDPQCKLYQLIEAHLNPTS